MNQRETGSKYEAIAADYLLQNGYGIRERNFHSRYGEIDIIAGKEDLLVACEVKYRSGGRCGDALEAVDLRKQKKICQTMLYYFARHGISEDTPCRFDVIAISGEGPVRHIKNAFEFRG
ncbi:MAG: YraN family protein [Eubacterium sp.]|nr:YraN family protein [Eubacterium sp.]